MNELEKLQNKTRAERTPIESCIVDAAIFEEAEHDGEIELMEHAANDLAALQKDNERLRELVLRAQNDMTAIESRCLTKNREKAKSLEFIPILNIASRWTTDELRKNIG